MRPARPAASFASLVCLGLAALLFAPACTASPGATVAPPHITEDEPDPPADPRQPGGEDQTEAEALGEDQLASGDEVMTFDGMDAEPGAPEQVRVAPQRQPVGRFKLFGEGPG